MEYTSNHIKANLDKKKRGRKIIQGGSCTRNGFIGRKRTLFSKKSVRKRVKVNKQACCAGGTAMTDSGALALCKEIRSAIILSLGMPFRKTVKEINSRTASTVECQPAPISSPTALCLPHRPNLQHCNMNLHIQNHSQTTLDLLILAHSTQVIRWRHFWTVWKHATHC